MTGRSKPSPRNAARVARPAADAPAHTDGPVKIGLLHSLSGTMALSETPLLDVERMAIEEINRAGGVLGRRLEPVVADGASAPERFAAAARELLADGASALFGCWTSASRKAVRPVVEAADSLLWYPVQYEGLEQSPHVCYSGSCLNQQIIPAVEWILQQFGKRLYLLGSDYVFPRTANQLIRSLVASRGGELAGEEYVELGARDFAGVLDRVRRAGPRALINTLNGDSNLAFYRQAHAAGLRAAELPIMATSVTETELGQVAGLAVGHFACWSYFQSLDTPENREFLARFRERQGRGRVVSAPAVTAYVQLLLWKQAVERAGTFAAPAVRRCLPGCAVSSPMGQVRIEANQHLSMPVRIGRLRADGQFEILWHEDGMIAPLPWLGVENLDFPGKEMVGNCLAAFADDIDYAWRLEHEITERKALEAALARTNAELEAKVRERTRQLEEELAERRQTEAALRRSRTAALNLMEDAVEARAHAERATLDLQREMQERKRAEKGLRDLAHAVDASGDVVFTTAPDGVITSVNAEFTRLYGYTADEIVGKVTPRILKSGQHPSEFYEQTWATWLRGETIRGELINRTKDGRLIDIETCAGPFHDDQGTLGGFLAIHRDISLRKRAEAEARLLQTIALGVGAATDLDEALAFVLRQVCDTTGWAMGEAWLPNDDRSRLACHPVWHSAAPGLEGFRQASRNASLAPGEGLPGRVWQTKQPEWFPDLNAIAVFPRSKAAALAGLKAGLAVPVLARGEVILVLDFFLFEPTDEDARRTELIAAVAAQIGALIERKRAEMEVQRLNAELEWRVVARTAQLEAANRELEAFSYSVSHDLRAPLRHLESFSRTLIEDYAGALDVQGRHYLERVGAAAQRMMHLIDGLIELSRVTRTELRALPVDLSATAQAIAAELQRGEPGRAVQFVIAPGLVASGDARLLHQVLENLFGNAWKYTSKHPTARIEFGAQTVASSEVRVFGGAGTMAGTPGEKPGTRTVYFVRDDGAGFEMQYVDRLFGPFQRLHSAREYEGTGIGLATVARIVHRHGGRIWAEGAVEQGATFYFTLEAERA